MLKYGLLVHEVFLGKKESLSGNSVNIFRPAIQNFLILCYLQNLIKDTSAGGGSRKTNGLR